MDGGRSEKKVMCERVCARAVRPVEKHDLENVIIFNAGPLAWKNSHNDQIFPIMNSRWMLFFAMFRSRSQLARDTIERVICMIAAGRTHSHGAENILSESQRSLFRIYLYIFFFFNFNSWPIKSCTLDYDYAVEITSILGWRKRTCMAWNNCFSNVIVRNWVASLIARDTIGAIPFQTCLCAIVQNRRLR